MGQSIHSEDIRIRNTILGKKKKKKVNKTLEKFAWGVLIGENKEESSQMSICNSINQSVRQQPSPLVILQLDE